MSGRLVLLAAVAIAMLVSMIANPAQAREYPWCAHYGGADNDSTNCGFSTIEQCRAAISGVGGFCQTNPRYIPPAAGRGSRASDRRH